MSQDNAVKIIMGEDTVTIVWCDNSKTNIERDDDSYTAAIKVLNGIGIKYEVVTNE